MKKYLYIIIASITIILSTSLIMNSSDDENGIQGLSKEYLESSINDYIDDEEPLQEDIDLDLMIELGDWKTFSDKQYIPKFESKVRQIESRKEIDNEKSMITDNKIPKKLEDIINILNPSNAGITSVRKDKWNFTYGVTQINVKLLPLAKYHYSDFETNLDSQLKFLRYYIDTKTKQGRSIKDVLNEYKYGKYN